MLYVATCSPILPFGSFSSSGSTKEPPAGGTVNHRMKRKLYSAVPGRTFVVIKPYQAQGEGEISIGKGEKVKGKLKRLSV